MAHSAVSLQLVVRNRPDRGLIHETHIRNVRVERAACEGASHKGAAPPYPALELQKVNITAVFTLSALNAPSCIEELRYWCVCSLRTERNEICRKSLDITTYHSGNKSLQIVRAGSQVRARPYLHSTRTKRMVHGCRSPCSTCPPWA